MLNDLIESDKEIEKEKHQDAGGGSGRSLYDIEQDEKKQ